MPGNKRWHFEVRDGTILLFRDGKEVTKTRELRMGPVKEVIYGAEHPQAKTFKLQALDVSKYNVYSYSIVTADYSMPVFQSAIYPKVSYAHYLAILLLNSCILPEGIHKDTAC